MRMRIQAMRWTLILSLVAAGAWGAPFPSRDIQLIVYTKPGGAIDVFARRFQKIAKKYTKATIVVVNKPGAGGLVALKHLLKRGKDGHTFAAVTKSNIGKMASAGAHLDIEKFNWLAMLVSDPEAIIVNRDGKFSDWAGLVKDAKAKKGEQKWVGPALGGNDHIMAQKTWKQAGIQAKWIPYAGGGKAMVNLMGGHSDVYVGNPGDVVGKPSLKVVAISRVERLKGKFAEVPTFKELGVTGLDNEIMWRGFVAKQGISPEAVGFYRTLIYQVSSDPEWKAFITDAGAEPKFVDGVAFKQVVSQDHKEFVEVLKSLKSSPNL